MVQPAFILPEEVYRWLVAQSLLNNYGEGVGQGQVRLPIECNMIFENGFLVANIIRSILSKSSQT